MRTGAIDRMKLGGCAPKGIARRHSVCGSALEIARNMNCRFPGGYDVPYIGHGHLLLVAPP